MLEAKLMGKDNDWWKSHSVLHLNTNQKESEIIISDITYQLKERLPFTKKPDLMMAAILKETGDYLTKHKKQEQAWIAYQIGMEYDKDSSFNLQEKISALQDYFSKNNITAPNYKSHFIKTDELIETGKNLIEQGFNIFNEHQKQIQKKQLEKKKRETRFWIIGGTVAIISLLTFVFFRKKKAV